MMGKIIKNFNTVALPFELQTRAGSVRILLIGILLQIILLSRPEGLIPEATVSPSAASGRTREPAEPSA